MDMNYRGGMWGREVVCGMEWSEGGKWDNCNSIINKYILKNLIVLRIIILSVSLCAIIRIDNTMRKAVLCYVTITWTCFPGEFSWRIC